jgi:protein-disulfide isomerase
MRIAFPSLLLVFLLAGGALQAQHPAPAAKTALDKPTLEAYVRHLFLWTPQVNVKIDDPKPSQFPGFQEVTVTASAGAASQEEKLLVSKDGTRIIRGTVYDITENPFHDELTKLKTDLSPSFGAPGAPVVIVLFSDFQCQYCKQEAKVIRDNLASAYPKEARVYFKDFPLDSIHPWAHAAAIGGRCVFRQAPTAFWDYHDWMFEHQADITPENVKAKMTEFATSKSLDTFLFNQCVETKGTEREVEKTMAEGKALHVDSTPTMFVNGRRLPGSLSWPQLRQVIDFELDYQKANADAGEKCCEVKLPSPLK